MPRLEWRAPIIASPERSPRWYLVGGICVIVFAAYGILTRNWTFALAVLLLGGTYFLLRNSTAPLHRLRVEDGGFLIDDEFIGWDDCESFWFVHLPEYTELHILKKKPSWNHEVIIQTGPVDPANVRRVLSEYLSEKSDQKERITDAIIRFLKL